MTDYKQMTIDTLKELVEFNSVNEPGNEAPLAEHIAKMVSEMGFTINIIPCGENRSSIVASLGNNKGKTILFNGHLDVVPATGKWSTDPFKAELIDGKLYGRGTADMKGGIAAMLTAARKLVDTGFEFKNGQMVLSFVADEELHNKGTLSILPLDEVANADFAIIGEPTSMDLNIAHRGTARFNIRVFGKSCHSSNPSMGLNAIDKMGKVLLAIQENNKKLSEIKHPVLPSPTIATVMIEGGEKDNIIPNYCEIKVDRRTIPTDTEESVEREIVNILEGIKKEDSQFEYTLERYIFLGAGEVDIDSQVTKIASEVFRKAFDKEPKIREFTATCEQTLFTRNGIETIIVGPGSIEQAHIVDEFVEVEQLNDAVIFYEEMVRNVIG